MNKCVKIMLRAQGKHLVYMRDAVEQAAREQLVEGAMYIYTSDCAEMTVAGSKERVDLFIDLLYRAIPEQVMCDISIEPCSKERDYRGVFRVIQ